jgi:hypothetical protein
LIFIQKVSEKGENEGGMKAVNAQPLTNLSGRGREKGEEEKGVD